MDRVINMIKVNPSDLVTVKALNVPGVVCSNGQILYFIKMEGLKSRCSNNNNLNFGFLIEERHILQVQDHLTNEITYQYDLASAW